MALGRCEVQAVARRSDFAHYPLAPGCMNSPATSRGTRRSRPPSCRAPGRPLGCDARSSCGRRAEAAGCAQMWW
eukprot:250615-Prorocentrum_minimum.AAC.1